MSRLVLKDLSKSFTKDKCVIPPLDLDVPEGSFVALLGPSGCGKTTLLRTLVQSLPALNGDVKWGFGCEIGTYAQHVYSSLPERKTVLEYLEYEAIPGTKMSGGPAPRTR